MQEVSRLVDSCIAKNATATATREARQASVLVHASLDALTQAAGQQARAVLSATGRNHSHDKGAIMTELSHEEEFLNHLTQAGVLSAQLIRALTGQSAGDAADVKALKAAGYKAETPFDEHLRHELGEQRWAKYATDPARIVCAALITDGDTAGYDMKALLSKVAMQRAWEDDSRSPAKSIARVLAFRITQELARSSFRRSQAAASDLAKDNLGRTSGGASPSTTAPTGADIPRQRPSRPPASRLPKCPCRLPRSMSGSANCSARRGGNGTPPTTGART